MKSKTQLKIAVAILAALIFSSCASTKLAESWKDSTYTAGPLKRVLVVAVRSDTELQRAWEDGFAAALSKDGVDATPAYKVYPGSHADSSFINTVAREGTFDGIVIVGAATTGTETAVTTGQVIPSPLENSHPWNAWYYAYYDRDYYPGYPVINVTVRDEISVWATHRGGRLIWTGVGEARGGAATDNARHAIIQLIVPQLVDQRVVDAE